MRGSFRARRAGAPLAAALVLLAMCAHASAASAADNEALDSALGEVEELLADAHFRTALSVAEATRAWADALPPDAPSLARRAQLQLLIATARVALSDFEGARENLRVARTLDAALDLDPATTSPKLLRLFRELRP